MKNPPITAAALFVAAQFSIPTVTAAETFPRIEGSIPIEVQFDDDYDSDDPGNQRNNLSTLIEPEATIHVAPGLSLFVHGVLEQVVDPAPGEDRFFDDQGLLIEDLYVAYQWDRFEIKGGKFTPTFGIAMEIAPGIYGTDFAEAGYEFAERIGIGGAVNFEDDRFGAHIISASTFFLDTSLLAESTLKGRGTTGIEDGGVSNTEDFSSFAIALEGGDIDVLPGFSYQLAFISQAAGRGGTADETGFAVSATHEMSFGDDFTFSPLVEYVSFDDADGTAGQDREFLTVAGQLDWQNWNMAISFTSRDTETAAGVSTDDESFQISAGYTFPFELSVDVAWRTVKEAGVDTQGIGLLIAHSIDF